MALTVCQKYPRFAVGLFKPENHIRFSGPFEWAVITTHLPDAQVLPLRIDVVSAAASLFRSPVGPSAGTAGASSTGR